MLSFPVHCASEFGMGVLVVRIVLHHLKQRVGSMNLIRFITLVDSSINIAFLFDRELIMDQIS